VWINLIAVWVYVGRVYVAWWVVVARCHDHPLLLRENELFKFKSITNNLHQVTKHLHRILNAYINFLHAFYGVEVEESMRYLFVHDHFAIDSLFPDIRLCNRYSSFEANRHVQSTRGSLVPHRILVGGKRAKISSESNIGLMKGSFRS